ncbi:hypothetical protein GCM10022243_16460 [Saccharothrix violaceirubra]|uniref:WD40 repeat protein n=1 Tax=Saccharothrix violaceirubra TaxID=413306 RepID=A0A7W7T6V4_9PSEU|nr:hypothetical protein [Saccharothrix violaceirubra]MBB4967664.1 WD40 repeat protein [Saccharothrix violaceirubra]
MTAGSASAGPAVVDACAITDPRLAELSGLGSDGTSWYAVADSDDGRIEVQVLDRSCAITRTIVGATDPFDVEDLALAPDGTLWLADTGDNRRSRQTVALHAVSPDGTTRLFRLTYPDGAHDAEALLLDGAGVPYIVTKEAFGSPLVYRPTGPLVPDGTEPLEQVAKLSLPGSDTTGGPAVGSVVTRVVTGGAMSRDGRVAAVRTYTDAYLYPVVDGDLATSLEADPVRVPLPGEPQGEALAFDPDGTLVSASEFGDTGASSAVRTVAGAAALAVPAPPPTTTTTAAPPASARSVDAGESVSPVWVIGGGLGALALLAFLVRRRRRT